MERSPHTLAALALQYIQANEIAPTPENFARVYYEISIKPMADVVPDTSRLLESAPCAELMAALHSLVDETFGVTDRLANKLSTTWRAMDANAESLRKSKLPDETLRQVVTLLAHASGLMDIIETSREELQQSQQSLRQMEEKLADVTRQLDIDDLTNTLNRRGMGNCLNRELARAKRYKGKLSLVMADLDRFKSINDTHGHEAGDHMIAHFAQLIRYVVRDADYIARPGGEEFVLILPEADLSHAQMVALRLQTILEKSPLVYGDKQIAVTFSAGIAECRNGEDGADLLRRADAALYAAKSAGRNCFRLAQ